MANWIITCNTKYYDVIGAFEKFDKLNWKQSTNIQVDDISYIYVAAPYSSIMYKCEVTKVNLSKIHIDDSDFVIDGQNYQDYGRHMELKLLKKYDKEMLPYEELKKNGLKSVQGPSKANEELMIFIDNRISGDDRTHIIGIHNSWEVLNENIAIKAIDLSTLKYKGTGIPKSMKEFFVTDIIFGEKKKIELTVGDKVYGAYLALTNDDLPRMRMFWDADLMHHMNETLPEYLEFLENKKNIDMDNKPLMRFSRTGLDTFQVDIINSYKINNEYEYEYDYEDREEKETNLIKEGESKLYSSIRYERNSVNRIRAIQYHGLNCMICDFNFEKVYGNIGQGFIEIHHVNPLSLAGEEVVVNPQKDLIPVCSNCHSIIHRKRYEILSIEAMKKIINKN